MGCSLMSFLKVWWRSIIDLVIIVLLFIIFIGLYGAEQIGSIVRRGFYCDDSSIKFPFKKGTVPSWALFVVCTCLPLLAIVGGNVYERFISHKAKPGKPFNVCGTNSQTCSIPFWIARTAYEIRWYIIGLLITLVVTDMGKIVVGRLRPNFLDVCNPDFSQFNCTDQFGNSRYVTDYVCRGEKHDVDASRVSWPSGHSSSSAYAFIFIALYVSSIRSFYNRSALKLFLMLIAFLLTMLTGLSRISDNKHHPTDVLSGWIIGSAVASIIVYYSLWYFSHLKSSENDEEDGCNNTNEYHTAEEQPVTNSK